MFEYFYKFVANVVQLVQFVSQLAGSLAVPTVAQCSVPIALFDSW